MIINHSAFKKIEMLFSNNIVCINQYNNSTQVNTMLTTSPITTETDNLGITFGDFATEEYQINLIVTSKYEKKDNSVYKPSVKNSSGGIFIIFGDFTPEECFNFQRPDHDLMRRDKSSPTNVYYHVPCIRCGYHSHTIDKCVARRNRYGELIWTPSQHKMVYRLPSSPIHANAPVYYNQHISLNNWCIADKTDYTQFVFSEEDVQEWIEEDNHSNHFSSNDFNYSAMDPNIDYMLGYIQALTDYVLYLSSSW